MQNNYDWRSSVIKPLMVVLIGMLLFVWLASLAAAQDTAAVSSAVAVVMRDGWTPEAVGGLLASLLGFAGWLVCFAWLRRERAMTNTAIDAIEGLGASLPGAAKAAKQAARVHSAKNGVAAALAARVRERTANADTKRAVPPAACLLPFILLFGGCCTIDPTQQEVAMIQLECAAGDRLLVLAKQDEPARREILEALLLLSEMREAGTLAGDAGLAITERLISLLLEDHLQLSFEDALQAIKDARVFAYRVRRLVLDEALPADVASAGGAQ